MPSEKRARQRAGREARMAELRRAQKRRRDLRRYGVVGVAIVLALVLAGLTSGVFSSGSSKKKTVTAPAPARPTPGQLTPAAAAALNTFPAPPVNPACTAAPPAAPGPTTTVPAKGNAVATIAAPGPLPFPALDGTAPHYTKFTAPPPFCLDGTKIYTATITTDLGPITVQLLPANAPLTVNNFVYLAGYHYFDGIIFHRVVKGFVDQGGDPTGTGSGNPGYQFADELPKSADAYDAGALAMANSGANTNGSQFFMVVAQGGQQLGKPAYSMFGQIINGINIMNQINADGATDSAGTPAVVHRIKSVTIQAAAPPPPAPPTTPPATPAPTTAPPTTPGPATTAPATTAPPAGTTSPPST